MKKNVGTVDRFVRLLLAVIIGVLYFTDQLTGLAAIVLGILAIIFLITGTIKFCPLYLPFKLSTVKEEET